MNSLRPKPMNVQQRVNLEIEAIVVGRMVKTDYGVKGSPTFEEIEEVDVEYVVLTDGTQLPAKLFPDAFLTNALSNIDESTWE